MTGPITNHPGLTDGKSTSTTGSKVSGQKPGHAAAGESSSGESSDQVSLSSTGLQLTGQASRNTIGNADEALAIAVRINSLFRESGAAALAAHSGNSAADLQGLLHSA